MSTQNRRLSCYYLWNSKVFILDTLSTLNVRYFPTFSLKNYKLKIKNQKNFKTKTWKNFQIFKIGLKLSQICQFMEKYLKIRIFFNLKEKKFPREKLKLFLNFRNLKMVSNVAEYANSWRNTKKFKLANFANFRNSHNSPKNCQICREIRKK